MRSPASLLLVLLLAPSAFASEYFISPSGSDANPGTEGQPFLTFNKAFTVMAGGDRLTLLDGLYTQSTTGIIHDAPGAPSSNAVPSGTAAARTVIAAKNRHRATIDGDLRVGRSTRKDRYITFDGVVFRGQGWFYNTDHDAVRHCFFSHGFIIGTRDHENGNTYDLVEDCVIRASQLRGIAQNYRAHFNVWRRVIIRGDGCNTTDCTTDPSIGITVYSSQHCSLQNVLVVDRILGGGNPYADFATAQHAFNATIGDAPLVDDEWLGCISLNSEDHGFQMEADAAQSPSHHLRDCVVAGRQSGVTGFDLGGDVDSTIERSTVVFLGAPASALIRRYDNTVRPATRNCIARGDARYGVTRGGAASYIDTWGTFSAARFESTTVSPGDIRTDPMHDGAPASLRYPVRVESNSVLKGAGSNGDDIGANVVQRIGVTGTHFGETGYNSVTAEPLWPWPDEADAKQFLCGDAGVTRGLCQAETLTKYVWEYFGNPIPPEIYGGGTPPPDTTPPTVPANVAATAVSSSQVDLAWSASSDANGVAGYRVDVSTGSAFSTFVAGWNDRSVGNVTSASVTGLAEQMTYYARVRAADAAGNVSASSATASATTPAAGGGPPPPSGCLVADAASAPWQNESFASQSATFVAEADVTPLAASVDAGLSLSNGPRGAWSELAATILFAPDGTIKAVNGGAYSGAIVYAANTSYHLRLVVDTAAHSYSAYVRPAGGAEQTLASNWAFRSGQTAANRLDHWTLSADAGSLRVCNRAVTPASACLTGSYPATQWQNEAFAAQSGTFTAEADITPASSSIDAGLSLSDGARTAWSDLAATVLFHPDGTVKAIDGGAYRATTIAYAAGMTYHVRLAVDVAAHTYASYIRPAGGAEALIGAGMAFRASQAAAPRLDHWTISVDDGSATVCNRAVTIPPTCRTASYPSAQWQNFAFTPKSGAFTAEADVTPSAAVVDVGVSLASGTPTAWSGLAVTILFAPDGHVKAIDGAAYVDSGIVYAQGVAHHVRMLVDVAAHRYSAWLHLPGGAEQLIGSSLSFRSTQASVTQLDHWTLSADASSCAVCDFLPRFETSAVLQQASDTRISFYDPNVNFDSDAMLLVIGGSENVKSLVKFDLSSLPAGAEIVSATLALYNYGHEASINSGQIAVDRALRPWVAAQATWSVYATGSAWSAPGMATGTDWSSASEVSIPIDTASGVWRQWDVTQIVRDWMAGAAPNYGLVVRSPTYGVKPRFYSSAYATDVTLRPKLTIVYR